MRGSAQAGQGAAPGAASLVQDYREKKETGRIRLEPALHEPPAPCGADILVEEER